MKQQMRLLIVDGSNLLFQMFFGMPARIVGAHGKAIQGTLGFVGALLKILRRVQPTHAVVLFDGEYENERKTLDADYKSNRLDYHEVPEEENPFSQLPDIYAALDHLGLCHAETTVCEADDWIAGYVHAYQTQADIVISSFDSDLFQLISDRVSVLRYRGDKSVICTPAYLDEKFGIRPTQYADFKALTGDASDHIKGADGIGPKTAAQLLRSFGSLEELLAKPEQIERPQIRASVIRNTERLRVNYRLIRLGTQVELPFSIDELVYLDIGITTTELLREIGLKD